MEEAKRISSPRKNELNVTTITSKRIKHEYNTNPYAEGREGGGGGRKEEEPEEMKENLAVHKNIRTHAENS